MLEGIAAAKGFADDALAAVDAAEAFAPSFKGLFNSCRVHSVKRLTLAAVARAKYWIRVGIPSTQFVYAPCYPREGRSDPTLRNEEISV